jgi:hypothetical protein
MEVKLGRAVDAAVSRRLATAATQVPAQLKSCGVCGGQSVTEAHFLRVPRFALPLVHCTNCSTIITIHDPTPVEYTNK